MACPQAVSVSCSKGRASAAREENLEAFLKARQAAREAPHHFTTASRPFGSYWVGEADMARFYDLYTSDLEQGKSMRLTERQGSEGPVVVDVDLRYPLTVKERLYTAETVRSERS